MLKKCPVWVGSHRRRNVPRVKTRGVNVKAAIRATEALELRISGMTLPAIAEKLGMAVSSVHDSIVRAMSKVEAPARELRDLEVERLDALLLAQWKNRADPMVARTIVRIMERRARLLGLDAPTKIEASGAGGGPIVVAADAETLRRMATEALDATDAETATPTTSEPPKPDADG